ncbi:hypothetical protein C8R46DRAFT_1038058 [Mycena filopes]|nr:hypothetical protein C8R46DRAFT_1038058 [Mycena filopes]
MRIFLGPRQERRGDSAVVVVLLLDVLETRQLATSYTRHHVNARPCTFNLLADVNLKLADGADVEGGADLGFVVVIGVAILLFLAVDSGIGHRHFFIGGDVGSGSGAITGNWSVGSVLIVGGFVGGGVTQIFVGGVGTGAGRKCEFFSARMKLAELPCRSCCRSASSRDCVRETYFQCGDYDARRSVAYLGEASMAPCCELDEDDICFWKPGDEDTYRHDAKPDGRYWVLAAGRGTGIFTNKDSADAQTNSYSKSAQRVAKRWPAAGSIWNDYCDELHGSGCPPVEAPIGFVVSTPVNRPPVAAATPAPPPVFLAALVTAAPPTTPTRPTCTPNTPFARTPASQTPTPSQGGSWDTSAPWSGWESPVSSRGVHSSVSPSPFRPTMGSSSRSAQPPPPYSGTQAPTATQAPTVSTSTAASSSSSAPTPRPRVTANMRIMLSSRREEYERHVAAQKAAERRARAEAAAAEDDKEEPAVSSVRALSMMSSTDVEKLEAFARGG